MYILFSGVVCFDSKFCAASKMSIKAIPIMVKSLFFIVFWLWC